MQRGKINACVWEDKKTVSFLSSNCQPTGNDTVNRTQRDGTVQAISMLHQWCVIAYNKFMEGVNYADQKRNDYRMPIKSRRWYRYLAFFFIETVGVNAFILRQLSPNHPKTSTHWRLLFKEKKCAFNELEQVGGQTHFAKQTKLNRCVYCASKGIRKRSTWGCLLCKVLCKSSLFNDMLMTPRHL